MVRDSEVAREEESRMLCAVQFVFVRMLDQTLIYLQKDNKERVRLGWERRNE